MAHGNISDVVACILLCCAIQCIWYPEMMFRSIGPFSPVFGTASKDLAAAIGNIGARMFVLGCMFSAVKWNKINGIMSGIGSILSVCGIVYKATTSSIGGGGLNLLHLYAAALFLGGIHVKFFPSNPVPPKTKNNHGNMSDKVAISMLILFAIPNVLGLYPFDAFLSISEYSKGIVVSEDLRTCSYVSGCFTFVIAMMLSGVKWNPANGKLSALGLFLASAVVAYNTYIVQDAGTFVPRPQYTYIVLLLLAGLHVGLFPSNPLSQSARKTK